MMNRDDNGVRGTIEVRMARAALGWSASRLASEATVGRSTITRIETGASVRSSTIKQVKDALTAAGIVFGIDDDRACVSVAFG